MSSRVGHSVGVNILDSPAGRINLPEPRAHLARNKPRPVLHNISAMLELDVHGLTVNEALKVFVEFYNRHVRSSSRQPVRVIHGWGSSGEGGKIRPKLRQLLAEAGPNLEWKPGEDLEGNPGVTIVYPRKIIHPRENELEAAMLEFCSIPRTESKIAGQFRKYEPREIKQVIRSLVRRGEMREILKAARSTYIRV
jgi:hypothetical protein